MEMEMALKMAMGSVPHCFIVFHPSIIGRNLSMKMIFQGGQLRNEIKIQAANELANWWSSFRLRFCKFNLRLPNWIRLALASIAWCFAVNQKCSSVTHLQFYKARRNDFIRISQPSSTSADRLTISRDRLHCCGKLVKFTYHWLLLFMYRWHHHELADDSFKIAAIKMSVVVATPLFRICFYFNWFAQLSK